MCLFFLSFFFLSFFFFFFFFFLFFPPRAVYCMTGGRTRQDIGAKPNLWLCQVFLEHAKLIRFAVSTSVNGKYNQRPYTIFFLLYLYMIIDKFWLRVWPFITVWPSVFFWGGGGGLVFPVFSIVPVFILVVIWKEKPSSFEIGLWRYGGICCPHIRCRQTSRKRRQ